MEITNGNVTSKTNFEYNTVLDVTRTDNFYKFSKAENLISTKGIFDKRDFDLNKSQKTIKVEEGNKTNQLTYNTGNNEKYEVNILKTIADKNKEIKTTTNTLSLAVDSRAPFIKRNS